MASIIYFSLISFRYWEVQVEVGESVQGWVFWTWKVSTLFLVSFLSSFASWCNVEKKPMIIPRNSSSRHTIMFSVLSFTRADIGTGFCFLTILKPARIFYLHPLSFRPRMQMNGVIKKVWRVVGSRRILQIGCILGFALEILYIGPA